MGMNNPWRGLASYDDPANINNEHFEFCGRDDEASQLVRLIDNSLFVTLYGRTGVGKTSLLKAGVFPVLRLHNYLPLYIRLSQGGKDKSYAEIIVAEIENNNHLKAKRQNGASLINNDGNSFSYLWDYFCQTKFYEDNDNEVYPVLVLDQFEEIFVTQDSKEKEKAVLLLRQIYALLSDDYVLLDKENFSDETNYRFVASIREDNLYLLEDCIDEHSLSIYKEDRYRLRPMKEQQARNAIFIPGKECIEEKDKDSIASHIIEAAKDKDGTISSLMLSFICSQLYDKVAVDSDNPLISIKLFNEHLAESKRLLSEFYLQHTSKKQRKIIEENYLTEDGHRKPSNITIPHSDNLVNKFKIMQDAKIENGDGLELVHDKLAEVVYMHRRQRDSKKFRYALCCVLGVILVALFGLSIFLSWNSSIPVGNPSVLAINKVHVSNKVDSFINDRIVNTTLSYNKDIKIVFIEKNVDSISSLYLSDEQRLFVSPQNKRIKSDYFYRYNNGDSVQYLYYIDNPQIAIWTQKDINLRDSLRLPNGIKEIEVDGWKTFKASMHAPYYGERDIVIKRENDFKYVKHDKRIQSVTIRNVPIVPYGQFEGCTNLITADLGVDKMELNSSCFKGCANLREVIFPKKLEGNYNSNEFYGCFNLEKVTLPDEVEYPEGLGQMFQWCPNIKDIIISETSRFHEESDGIVYYDSIPVIVTKCNSKDWVSKDSTLQIVNAIVVQGSSQINILPQYWEKDHFSITSLDDGGKIHATGYTVYHKQRNTVLDLPMTSASKFIYANYNPYLKEIHSPVADPKLFELKHPVMEDMSNVTLFVPYGCKDAYYESGKFKEYREIREDAFMKRIASTVHYYWAGVKWTFGILSWLLYPLVFLLLLLLAFIFYKLRLYQMKRRGIVSKRKAILSALVADISAIIGFVPVYYCIYWFGINHFRLSYKLICFLMLIVLLIFAFIVMRLIIDTIKKRLYWPFLLGLVVILGFICLYFVYDWGDSLKYYNFQCICLSSFFGGLSGYVCSYLAVFAGNGKILNKMKRWKLNS